MVQANKDLLRNVIAALGIVGLLAAFTLRASQNLARIDYRNSNFVFFWFAGRMVVTGENPYNEAQWLAQHESNGVAWRPDRTFLYPLPLAFILTPLGLLPLKEAYFGWQIFSQFVLAVAALLVLRSSGAAHPGRLWFPLVLGLLFFGPVYLTLQIGALGAFTLGTLTAAILALDGRRELIGGALLSLLLLKPSQGLPIVLLCGIWLLSHRSWNAILGIAMGSVALLLVGILLDPAWPVAFAGSSQGLMTRNLGLQSTVFSLASHVCVAGVHCTWILGGAAAFGLGAATLAYLWRRRPRVTHLEAFSLIVPISFVTAVYGWSYDQILYVIPIAWVAGRLARRRRGYAAAGAFVLTTVLVSLVALGTHAYTGIDVLSSFTSFMVLVGIGAAYILRHDEPGDITR
jgi:hypothetical protein